MIKTESHPNYHYLGRLFIKSSIKIMIPIFNVSFLHQMLIHKLLCWFFFMTSTANLALPPKSILLWNTSLMCTGCIYVNVIQSRVIRKEECSIEKNASIIPSCNQANRAFS